MIKRFFLNFYNIDPDGRHIFGRAGEEYAKKELSGLGYNMFFNRIIHSYKNPKQYIESDIIVYSDSCIFCIEVKRLKGKIFPTNGGIVQETHRTFEKRYRGYRAKRIKDPVEQSKLFTKSLKHFLTKRDARFQTIDFIWVTAFSEEADISSIYSFENGILYISELSKFIQSYLKKSEKKEWVLGALKSLKGFDFVINKNGLCIMGFISGRSFKCNSLDGIFTLPYSQIKKIEINRGGLFSKCDKAKIFKNNNKIIKLCCIEGYILLNVFGDRQKHFLRNIIQLKIESI